MGIEQGLLLSVLAMQAVTPTITKRDNHLAIARAKDVNVSSLDAALGDERCEAWLRRVTRPEGVTSWEVTGCDLMSPRQGPEGPKVCVDNPHSVPRYARDKD